MSNEIFLIDSNSFIAPSHTYYAFDLAPSFWRQLQSAIQNGRVVVLDRVFSEISAGNINDPVNIWLQQCAINDCLINTSQIDIIFKYQEIINYIENNKCYKASAVHEWSKDGVADAWLIATSACYGYTLITFEKGRPVLSSVNPSSTPKIPEVAEHFSVSTKDLFYMMRQLGIILSDTSQAV